MAYIVADPCVMCKHTDCVAVCPVDCFYEGVNMLVIHPDECIDCGACEPECPVEAIFEEGDLPDKWQIYVGINAVYSGAKSVDEVDTADWSKTLLETTEAWPNITEQKEALPTAEAAAKEENKLSKLDPNGFAG